jgi:hypothetical protein
MLPKQENCKIQLTLSECCSLHHAYTFAYCLYIENTFKREQNLRVKKRKTPVYGFEKLKKYFCRIDRYLFC